MESYSHLSPARTHPDREAPFRAAPDHQKHSRHDRTFPIHRQQGDETRPMARLQRERIPSSLQAEAAQDWPVDGRTILLGSGRAEEGRAEGRQVPQAHAHGFEPAARVGAERVTRGWTPQLIDGGPKAGFPDDPAMRVGHECLYQWIRAKGQRALDLRQYPPRGVGSATSNPTPPSARLRRNDASTRRSSARAASCSPDSSRTRAPWGPRAEYDIYRDIPPTARIDRTRDNGTESSRHPLVDEDLQAIVEEINDAPMKILGYETPNEAWQREIERSCSSPDPTAGVALAK